MSSFKFSEKNLSRLRGVHPLLISLADRNLKLSSIYFENTEGLRTLERQNILYRECKTEMLNIRHLTGHAIDVMAYPTPQRSWNFSDY